MHEVITLQFGQRSNYLATHFWNTQESYFTYSDDQEPVIDHDIHWRPGIGADGSETFMPRTVIYDLKGGFGSLKKINALYEIEDDGRTQQGVWPGQTIVQRQAPIGPSAYQQSLDAGLEPAELTAGDVRYWSDFSRVFYHPRSIVQLNEYELNSSIAPFERWHSGEDLFVSLDKEHDLVDRDLRPFVEEADQMQAVQIFATLDDAWGGFASRYLEALRDEYGKTPIWVWAQQDPLSGVPREKRLLRLANKARTLAEAYRHASLVVPLSLPRATSLPPTVSLPEPASPWNTSALLASAMESATLPFRLRDRASRETFGAMTDALNGMGKQTIAALQMSVRGPARHQDSHADSRVPTFLRRAAHDDASSDDDASGATWLDIDFSPSDEPENAHRQNGHSRKPHVFGQAITTRGPRGEEQKEEERGEEEEEEEDQDRRQRPGDLVLRRYHSDLAFPMLDSFPRIFLATTAAEGEGNTIATLTPLPRGQPAPPLTAALTTDSTVEARLRLLRTTVGRSIGLEDREALGNDLAEMADEYHEGWSSGSDEGDDDEN